MSDEKIDPPAPRVHVGVGRVVERGDAENVVRRAALPASRRQASNIPENLNDVWWRNAKGDKPVDNTGVLFIAVTRQGDAVILHYASGARVLRNGVFQWEDGSQTWTDDQVLAWTERPSLPKFLESPK